MLRKILRLSIYHPASGNGQGSAANRLEACVRRAAAHAPVLVGCLLGALAVMLTLAAAPTAGRAQEQPASQAQTAPKVPNFWDLQRRVERPDAPLMQGIRFITDDEYPPFGLTAPDGTLTGFNVDLARAICRELAVECTIQRRRFDTILPAIEKREADAAIASIAITPSARERVLFTHPYYRTPARFVARTEVELETIGVDELAGRTVGVVENSAHSAYLAQFFPRTQAQTFTTRADLFNALRDGDIAIAFADGVTLAIWLNSPASQDCCAFRGGPYTESRFFGEGVGVAVHQSNTALRQLLDYALMRLAANGGYAELYMKYFPIGFY